MLVTSWSRRGKAFLLPRKTLNSSKHVALNWKPNWLTFCQLLKLVLRRSTPLESVTIASKAGDEGKLFGSIGTRDIADAVTAAGVKVAKSEVRLPNGVLRNVGEHEVDFQVHSEVFAKVIINVVAE